MKEELQGKLVEILTSIQTVAGKAGDFAIEQLPDIAQQYVAYGRAAHTVGVFLGCALLIFAVFSVRASFREQAKRYGERNEGIAFGGLMAGIAGTLVGLAVVGTNASAALLVWFAPKVWLLKEIASLVK